MLATVLALFGLIAAGCLGETTCRELGCSEGEECNYETGQCEPLDQDCQPGGCPTGEVCDLASGQCQPELPSCGQGQSCPDGLQCNVETGQCEVDPGCTPDSCPSPAASCNPSTNRCEPIGCDNDPECPEGYICTDGSCSSGCRGGSERCPPNRFCSSESTGDIGQCLPECRSNQSCPHGQICTQMDGLRACRPEGPCDEDADCRVDEVCINRRCVAPPCSSDEDCDGQRSCHLASGLCVGGDCQEDSLSPNHRPDTAASIEANTYTGLTLCPARDDWYAFEASSSQALTIQLEYASRMDLDFFVYNESDRLIAQNSRPAPGPGGTTDRTTFFSTRPQRIRIQVTGQQNTPDPVSVEYSLEVRPNDERFCADDEEEENDDLNNPTAISGEVGVPTDLSLQICGTDRDVFELDDIEPERGLEVSLQESAARHIRLGLYAIESPVSHTLKPGESKRWLRVGDVGGWSFRVFSRVGESSPYTFTYQIRAPWACPDARAFNAADRAKSVEPGATTHYFCPLESGWEVDWLALDPPAESGDLLRAVIDTDESMPQVSAALFERTGSGDPALIRHATHTSQGLELAASFEASDTPLIRVSSTQMPGTIGDEPTYELSYNYE